MSDTNFSTDFKNSMKRITMLFNFIGLHFFDNRNSFMLRNGKLIMFWVCAVIPLNLSQFFGILISHKNGAFLDVIDVIPCFFTFMQAALKLALLSMKKGDIRNIIKEVAELWPPTDTLNDEKAKVYKEWLNRLDTFNKVFYMYSIFAITTFVFSSLSETLINIMMGHDTEYLFPIVIPLLYEMNLIRYLITFCFVTYWLLPTHMCVYVACDMLIVTLTGSLSILLRLLQIDLENLVQPCVDNDEDSVNNLNSDYTKIKKIVQIHQNLLRLSDELNKVFGVIIFCNITFSSIVICCFGFLVVASDNLSLILRNSVAVFGIMYAIYNFAWPGQILYDMSSGIADAAYNSLWYECDIVTRKYILIIILRSQRPCCLSALGFSDMTLATFSKVLSTSWSYLSLLNQMYEDIE